VFGFLIEIGLQLGVFGLFLFQVHKIARFLFVGNFQFIFKIIDFDFQVAFLLLKLLLELKASMLSFGFEDINLIQQFFFILLPIIHSLVKLYLKSVFGLSFQGKCFS
jgi:hypothetical protein